MWCLPSSTVMPHGRTLGQPEMSSALWRRRLYLDQGATGEYSPVLGHRVRAEVRISVLGFTGVRLVDGKFCVRGRRKQLCAQTSRGKLAFYAQIVRFVICTDLVGTRPVVPRSRRGLAESRNNRPRSENLGVGQAIDRRREPYICICAVFGIKGPEEGARLGECRTSYSQRQPRAKMRR